MYIDGDYIRRFEGELIEYSEILGLALYNWALGARNMVINDIPPFIISDETWVPKPGLIALAQTTPYIRGERISVPLTYLVAITNEWLKLDKAEPSEENTRTLLSTAWEQVVLTILRKECAVPDFGLQEFDQVRNIALGRQI